MNSFVAESLQGCCKPLSFGACLLHFARLYTCNDATNCFSLILNDLESDKKKALLQFEISNCSVVAGSLQFYENNTHH